MYLSRLHPRLAAHLLILVLTILPTRAATASSPFFQDNAYNFRALHEVRVGGHNLSDIAMEITSNGDYRLFRVLARNGAFIGSTNWQIIRTKVDMNDDGQWDLDANGIFDSQAIDYWYPVVPSGTIVAHRVKIEVGLINNVGLGDVKVAYDTLYALSDAVNVYRNTENDVLLQIRNQAISTKVPVVLVEGWDALNNTYHEAYHRSSWQLIYDHLYPADCEVYILNFKEGGADMRLNADVLLKALDALHQLSPSNRIAVIGFSMGGVIARYALAKREELGLEHNVGLFVSFDSPQKWAHISPSLQAYVRSQTANNPIIADLQEALQSLSAKQQLLHNAYDVVIPISERENFKFYADLDTLNGDGYPDKSYNAAISNGNLGVTYPETSDGDWLASFEVIHKGENIPIETVNAVPLDLGAGSLHPSLKQIHWGDLFQIPFVADVDYRLQFYMNPIFIHTWSALSLNDNQWRKIDQFGNIELIGTPPPFDAYVLQPEPASHNTITTTSRNAITAWLDQAGTVAVDYLPLDGGGIGSQSFAANWLRSTPITITPKTAVVNGKLLTYTFAHWSDGSTQNPRSFFASRNAQTAVMKAVLTTNVSGNEAISGQPRIAETGGSVHAVYESNDAVWYCNNPPAGGTPPGNQGWVSQRLASTVGVAAREPAIAARMNGPLEEVAVGWLEGTGTIAHSWLLQAPVRIQIGNPNASRLLLPDVNSLVWAESPAGRDGIFYFKNPQTNSWGISIATNRVPETEGNGDVVSSPAICTGGECSSLKQFRLAFVKGNKVYVMGFYDSDPGSISAPPLSCWSPFDVTTPGWTGTNPTIASHGSNVFVAWEESNGSMQRIAFRQRSDTTWSSTVYFTDYPHVVSKPVIGVDLSCNTYECGRLNLLWQCSVPDTATSVYPGVASRLLGSSTAPWSGVEHLGQGRTPSVAGTVAYEPGALWTSGNSAPYDIPTVVGPKRVTNLWSDEVSETVIPVYWSAPVLGNGMEYDLRYDISPIDATNFQYKPQVPGVQPPLPPGSWEFSNVTGLVSGMTYYFALKTKGPFGNWSPISNVFSATTLSGGGGCEFCGEAGKAPVQPASSAAAVASANLAVEMVRGSDGGPIWSIYPLSGDAAAEAGIDSAGVHKQRRDENGEWKTWQHYLPAEAGGRFALRALRRIGRTVFVGSFSLQQVWKTARGGDQSFDLVLGAHSRLGDLTESVRSGGSEAFELLPGDTVTLTYGATTAPAENAPDVFLKVGQPGSNSSTKLQSRTGMMKPLPTSFALQQNQPNPWSNETNIAFDLPLAVKVRLEVFDMQGRLIRRLVDEPREAGSHSVRWDRRDQQGISVPSGVYVYRVQAGPHQARKTMVLLP